VFHVTSPVGLGVTEKGDGCECCIIPSSERNVQARVSDVLVLAQKCLELICL